MSIPKDTKENQQDLANPQLTATSISSNIHCYTHILSCFVIVYPIFAASLQCPLYWIARRNLWGLSRVRMGSLQNSLHLSSFYHRSLFGVPYRFPGFCDIAFGGDPIALQCFVHNSDKSTSAILQWSSNILTVTLLASLHASRASCHNSSSSGRSRLGPGRFFSAHETSMGVEWGMVNQFRVQNSVLNGHDVPSSVIIW